VTHPGSARPEGATVPTVRRRTNRAVLLSAAAGAAARARIVRTLGAAAPAVLSATGRRSGTGKGATVTTSGATIASRPRCRAERGRAAGRSPGPRRPSPPARWPSESSPTTPPTFSRATRGRAAGLLRGGPLRRLRGGQDDSLYLVRVERGREILRLGRLRTSLGPSREPSLWPLLRTGRATSPREGGVSRVSRSILPLEASDAADRSGPGARPPPPARERAPRSNAGPAPGPDSNARAETAGRRFLRPSSFSRPDARSDARGSRPMRG
jgi:hypothetical protein